MSTPSMRMRLGLIGATAWGVEGSRNDGSATPVGTAMTSTKAIRRRIEYRTQGSLMTRSSMGLTGKIDLYTRRYNIEST
jgi:hypothetical protein